MNKNSKRIRASFVKNGSFHEHVPCSGYHNDLSGKFKTRHIEMVKYVAKKKSKQFPRPNSDVDLSIQAQKRLFHPHI